jgi:hypothetical protein
MGCGNSTTADDGVVAHKEIERELKKRGVENPRVLEGLILGFDLDKDGYIRRNEFQEMIKHVDALSKKGASQDPPDVKAFLSLGQSEEGVFEEPGNPKLKMYLTSSGLMPDSTLDLKSKFAELKEKTPGNGVLLLIDARLSKLQFAILNGDPAKHNQQARVPYKREPDEPGGNPQRDDSGALVMKSQEELMNMGREGFAGVTYNMRHRGHYANGHLAELTCGVDETPVNVAYLWYQGKVVDGKPDYKIMVGRGVWRGGKYVAIKTDGSEFAEADYEIPCTYSTTGDHFFKETSDLEWGQLLSDVQVAYGVGGIPYLPIMHYQPYFVDDGRKLSSQENPYGKLLLDHIKDGDIVYMGMSAGAMAFGFTLGPLTTDPDNFMLKDETDPDATGVDLGTSELGKFWLFPGLGKYVGMPHDISLKVHLTWDPTRCAYGGTAHKAEAVSKVISGIKKKERFCALMADYDWYAGQGDAMEVSDGKLTYHVGYSAGTDPVPEGLKEELKKLNFEGDAMPRQPPNNSPEGWSFEWSPKDGEIFAAGPKANKPFHMYASSFGMMKDGHPAFSKEATQEGQV